MIRVSDNRPHVRVSLDVPVTEFPLVMSSVQIHYLKLAGSQMFFKSDMFYPDINN